MAYSVATWKVTQDGWTVGKDLTGAVMKYLVKSNDVYYSFINDEWVVLNVIDVAGDEFEEYGMDDLSFLLPRDEDVSPISQLENPILVISSETLPIINATLSPHSQLAMPSGDIILRRINQVNKFELTVMPEDAEDIKIICSVDSGENWLTYSTEVSQFQPIEIDDLDEIETNGMTINTFNSIGLKWNDIIMDGKIRFAYYLGSDNIGILSGIDKLTVDV